MFSADPSPAGTKPRPVSFPPTLARACRRPGGIPAVSGSLCQHRRSRSQAPCAGRVGSVHGALIAHPWAPQPARRTPSGATCCDGAADGACVLAVTVRLPKTAGRRASTLPAARAVVELGVLPERAVCLLRAKGVRPAPRPRHGVASLRPNPVGFPLRSGQPANCEWRGPRHSPAGNARAAAEACRATSCGLACRRRGRRRDRSRCGAACCRGPAR